MCVSMCIESSGQHRVSFLSFCVYVCMTMCVHMYVQVYVHMCVHVCMVKGQPQVSFLRATHLVF